MYTCNISSFFTNYFSQDEMYIQQGSEALERLRIMTSSNDGWVLEKNQVN